MSNNKVKPNRLPRLLLYQRMNLISKIKFFPWTATFIKKGILQQEDKWQSVCYLLQTMIFYYNRKKFILKARLDSARSETWMTDETLRRIEKILSEVWYIYRYRTRFQRWFLYKLYIRQNGWVGSRRSFGTDRGNAKYCHKF